MMTFNYFKTLCSRDVYFILSLFCDIYMVLYICMNLYFTNRIYCT